MMLCRLDRYLVARTLPPMAGVLASLMVAFLMERLLRSVDLLAQTSKGFDFLLQLAVNLTPHYVGLVLPAGFFIGLFVVVNRLNMGSEIDAMLASGVSLGRIAAPLVALGCILMMLSVLLYGFIQPYSRYAYRAVLHAAENAGWNGEVRSQAVLSPTPDLVLTADDAEATGRRLERVFIRRRAANGREEAFTAAFAELRNNSDNRSITLELNDGQLLITSPDQAPSFLTFRLLTLRLPLVPTAKLLRARGALESELTLLELAQLGFAKQPPALPRQTLLAELYSRLARAIVLPVLPLLALPFGLTAKRAGSAPAIGIAGLMLFGFQSALLLTQGMAAGGRLSAAAAVGWPTGLFAAACIAAFLASRKRPGENPVNWVAERISDAIVILLGRHPPERR